MLSPKATTCTKDNGRITAKIPVHTNYNFIETTLLAANCFLGQVQGFGLCNLKQFRPRTISNQDIYHFSFVVSH